MEKWSADRPSFNLLSRSDGLDANCYLDYISGIRYDAAPATYVMKITCLGVRQRV